MNLIHHKLRSRRGASISFALLLFLVCAVVGSVVLVAGTAAAGRISQAAEADQRYYSVTSAAELLRKEIEGKTVTTEEITEQVYDIDDSGNVMSVGGSTEIRKVKTADNTVSYNINPPVFPSIIMEAANHLRWIDTPIISDRNLELTAEKNGTVDIDDSAITNLAISAIESVSGDGTITISLYNIYDARGNTSVVGSQFKLILSFQAEISSVQSHTEQTPIATGYVQTTTKTQDYTWTLKSINTAGKR